MNKVFLFLGVVVGLMLIGWGLSLIHHYYVSEREAIYLLKAGIKELPREISESHSEQAVKDMIVHLGLILFGTSIITYVIYRKSNT